MEDGEVFINPLTDFGFKLIFGTEMNKDLLISFLNALFDGEQVITDVNYQLTEKLGTNKEQRRAIFDVYCVTEKNTHIIVEMQNVYQQFYKDRSIYYSTFPIRDQVKRGTWDYNLHDVYTVGILNFAFPEDREEEDVITRKVKLHDVKTKKVFYDKLTYFYVELVNFNKQLSELETIFDKWLYALRHMQDLMNRPAELQERVFARLFDAAKIAKLDEKELLDYEESMSAFRDIKNAIDTAERDYLKKGEEIGIKKGIFQTAQKLKKMGLSSKQISEGTGLSLEEIENL